MFCRVALSLMLMASFGFGMSASMVQTASKDELGCIKGLGKKRIEALMDYRKKEKINTLDELLNIKGIGKSTLNNIQNNVKKKVCTNFNLEKSEKKENRKKDIKAE